MVPHAPVPALQAADHVTPPLDASQVTVAVKFELPPLAPTVLGKAATATSTGIKVIVSLIDVVELQGSGFSVSQAGVAVMVTGRPPEGMVEGAVYVVEEPLAVGVGLNDPHEPAGEQLQTTPCARGSYETVAPSDAVTACCGEF
jgi:hypothetical protein